MIKPLATMLTMFGVISFFITLFVFLNNPSNIDYNGAVKYSMVDSGVAFSFMISSLLSIAGIALLKLSKVDRYV